MPISKSKSSKSVKTVADLLHVLESPGTPESRAWVYYPDDERTPGIGRIELHCDLAPGGPGITQAKVRHLRARICRKLSWLPRHAGQLTLDEAADVLEDRRRVTINEFQGALHGDRHHGLGTLDHIYVGSEPGDVVQVTGLSCKIIAGTTPTACPHARPVLAPSLLALAERAIRRLYPLPQGLTIHWNGHDTGYRSRCRCHPNAPYAAPFDQHRWAIIVPEQPQAELTRAAATDVRSQQPEPGKGVTPYMIKTSTMAEFPSVKPARKRLLTDRCELILREMLSLGAIGGSGKVPRDTIAHRVRRDLSGVDLGRDFQTLKKHAYTDSLVGRDGGVWLTTAGKSKAEELNCNNS